MRGTPLRMPWLFYTERIIPAYAGNTRHRLSRRDAPWDHPRVCGEHAQASKHWPVRWGSSPRMRGTHQVCRRRCNLTGIIPAYAGNTQSMKSGIGHDGDHPRVCGEHTSLLVSSMFIWGSSPRMRGTLALATTPCVCRGIIPAYAGNTARTRHHQGIPWDHPRVCGEHQERGHTVRPSTGSSPRMRGTPFRGFRRHVEAGIIPAYAGNTI